MKNFRKVEDKDLTQDSSGKGALTDESKKGLTPLQLFLIALAVIGAGILIANL